jgi:hypothetical protein
MISIKNVTASFILLLALACTVHAWRGVDHDLITQAACQAVPDEMQAWRAYGPLLGEHGVDPDLWKDADPKEPHRHFIDLELWSRKPLPRTLDTTKTSKRYIESGTAPWVIMNTWTQLVANMRSGNWPQASRVAAALGHYVADTHMPLHTTENYDGQYTGNRGLHLRWESEMSRRFGPTIPVTAETAVLIKDPWPVLTNWIIEAYANVEPIFRADNLAQREADINENSHAYYLALWNESKNIFAQQRNVAAHDLASLYYSAWVAAGKPSIPAPPREIPGTSIFVTPESKPDSFLNSSWVALALLIVVGGYIITMSIIKTRRG